MKNWKSTLAFFIFVGVYLVAVYQNRSADVLEVVGYIALYSSIFMMFRSDFTASLLEKIIDNIKIGGKS